jgi:hypothetical protein
MPPLPPSTLRSSYRSEYWGAPPMPLRLLRVMLLERSLIRMLSKQRAPRVEELCDRVNIESRLPGMIL